MLFSKFIKNSYILAMNNKGKYIYIYLYIEYIYFKTFTKKTQITIK